MGAPRFFSLAVLGSCLGTAAFSAQTAKTAPIKKPLPDFHDPNTPANIVCDQLIEDFSKADAYGLPERWTSHSSSDLKRAQKDKIYQVATGPEGTFLRAVAKGDGVILHLNIKDWNLKDHPILRWKWRVHELPLGGAEDKSATNDAAAAVYAIWKSSFVMRVKSIKMTWSSTLDPGTHIAKRLGFDHVQVMRKGPELKDRWVTEVVNLEQLAARYYPKEKDAPIAIALMSDGDNTKSPSSADYAGFELCRSLGVTASVPVKTRDPAFK